MQRAFHEKCRLCWIRSAISSSTSVERQPIRNNANGGFAYAIRHSCVLAGMHIGKSGESDGRGKNQESLGSWFCRNDARLPNAGVLSRCEPDQIDHFRHVDDRLMEALTRFLAPCPPAFLSCFGSVVLVRAGRRWTGEH